MELPIRSHARKLIIGALALVGCRIVSAWDSIVAGAAALVVLAVLAASIIANMPRVRRIALLAALPAATLANAVVFALGSFVMLLGAQGLLENGLIGRGPPWNWAFAFVPLAAITNLAALMSPFAPRKCFISLPRSRHWVWLANLASAAYAVWFWPIEEAHGPTMGSPIPVMATVLIGLAIVSLATVAWDTRTEPPPASAPRRLPRRQLLSGAAALVAYLLWMACFPVYRKRQIDHSLGAFGLSANFGTVFPGWRLPFELPFEWYAYLGEVTGAAAPESLKGDASQAGRLLTTLPLLDVLIVNYLPVGGGRILQPLAGHKRLRQIALKGAGVTDDTIADAARIPALYSAVFERAQISDEALAHFAHAPWLHRLAIRRTPISAGGLAYLKSLPRLAQLELSGTNFGDEQAALLVEFKALTAVSLNDTRLSDEGLAPLAKCNKLQMLDIRGTRVTAAGAQRLRRALPACNVVWSVWSRAAR